MTHARDEAAEKYAEQNCDWIEEIMAFQAGAKWAIAHDPVVVQMREALERIIGLTHSWVIAEQTVNCRHTYDQIRIKATETLARIKGDK